MPQTCVNKFLPVALSCSRGNSEGRKLPPPSQGVSFHGKSQTYENSGRRVSVAVAVGVACS